MSKKTAKGMYCSPGSVKGIGKSGSSCYKKEQLVQIINEYNRKYSSNIDTRGNKDQLWTKIEKKMLKHCDSEWCWLDNLDLSDNLTLKDTFIPIRPKGKYQWLSTSDIRNVLKQYEHSYANYAFLGPVPIDFCTLGSNEVCNINLKTSKRNGKTKLGIVFNTDPSNKPGKHWISMFIDISDPDPHNHEIGYFDSYGMAPILPEIRTLISNLKKQNPYIKLKLNCTDDICSHSIRHQKNNSECGMYSINFIVTRLTGSSWEDIVVNGRWSDENMVKLRKKYFRPGKGIHHHN